MLEEEEGGDGEDEVVSKRGLKCNPNRATAWLQRALAIVRKNSLILSSIKSVARR